MSDKEFVRGALVKKPPVLTLNEAAFCTIMLGQQAGKDRGQFLAYMSMAWDAYEKAGAYQSTSDAKQETT